MQMGKVSYLDLSVANQTIQTTNIKGKDYAEVNQRIKAFRMVYPDGIITSQMLSNEDGVCVFKAMVGYYEDDVDGCVRWLGEGHAYEKEDSTFINKTSYIENCETSAIGRALGMAGFGIDVSVASAEEVANAIENQRMMELTEKEAKEFKITFGKYEGKTLEEILKVDSKYVQWLIDNKNDEYMRKCYEVLTGVKLPTEEEQDERIKLIGIINQLELDTDTDHEEMLKHFKVSGISEMTISQLNECKEILEKKKK